jgi:multicomponent Na+:H+ antiporter subunit D
MLVAMGISAAACIAIGCYPRLLWDLLPGKAGGMTFGEMYSVTHIVTQLQLLFLAALAVFWLMRAGIYPPEVRAVNVDADWLPRRGARVFVRLVEGPLMRLFSGFSHFVHESVPMRMHHAARNPGGAMQLVYDRFLLGLAGFFGGPEEVDRAQVRLRRDQSRYAWTRPGAAWPIGTTVLYSVIAFVIFLLVYLL